MAVLLYLNTYVDHGHVIKKLSLQNKKSILQCPYMEKDSYAFYVTASVD